MKVIQRIALDFNRKTLPITVFAKQNDTRTRFLEITPLNCGQAYTLEDGITPRLQLTKADGHTVLNDAIVENGVIVVELTPQALAAAGVAIAEVGLYKGEALLSSQIFYIDVELSAFDKDAPESSNEYNSLVEAFVKANTATDRANTAAEKAESIANDVDTIISNSLKNTKKYYDLVLPGNDGDGDMNNFPFTVRYKDKEIEAFAFRTESREPSSSPGYGEINCYIAVYYLEDDNKIPIFKDFTPSNIESVSFFIQGKPEDPMEFTEDITFDWKYFEDTAKELLPNKVTASIDYEEGYHPYFDCAVYKLSLRADNLLTQEEYTDFTTNFALIILLIVQRAKDITITWSKYDADKSDVALSDGFTQV